MKPGNDVLTRLSMSYVAAADRKHRPFGGVWSSGSEKRERTCRCGDVPGADCGHPPSATISATLAIPGPPPPYGFGVAAFTHFAQFTRRWLARP